jgi:hypothetical protein
MIKRVISFYPGAGGNRYLRMLQNEQWQETNKIYDYTDKHFGNRYLEDIVQEDIVLTHSVDSAKLKSIFPDHQLLHIKSDLKLSLRREWLLIGIDRYCKRVDLLPDKLEHYKAYKDYNWPDVYNEVDLSNLPKHIVEEIEENYNQVLKYIDIEKESCVSTIKWHKNYYKENPLNLSRFDKIIDINDNSEFSTVMKQELLSCQSEIFDEIWDSETE